MSESAPRPGLNVPFPPLSDALDAVGLDGGVWLERFKQLVIPDGRPYIELSFEPGANPRFGVCLRGSGRAFFNAGLQYVEEALGPDERLRLEAWIWAYPEWPRWYIKAEFADGTPLQVTFYLEDYPPPATLLASLDARGRAVLERAAAAAVRPEPLVIAIEMDPGGAVEQKAYYAYPVTAPERVCAIAQDMGFVGADGERLQGWLDTLGALTPDQTFGVGYRPTEDPARTLGLGYTEVDAVGLWEALHRRGFGVEKLGASIRFGVERLWYAGPRMVPGEEDSFRVYLLVRGDR